MTQIVTTPDGTRHEFPDEATPEQMMGALKQSGYLRTKGQPFADTASAAADATAGPRSPGGLSFLNEGPTLLAHAAPFLLGAGGGMVAGIPGATVGGMLGKGIEQAATGTLPRSPKEAVDTIGGSGLEQGGLQLGGSLLAKGAGAAAKGLMSAAVRPSANTLMRDPGLIERMLADRQPVGKLPGIGTAGSVSADAARQAAAGETRSLLDAATAGGATLAADHPEIASAVAQLRRQVARGTRGAEAATQVDDLWKSWLDSHPGALTPNEMKPTRVEVQGEAKPLLDKKGVTIVTDAGQRLAARFADAVQRGIGRAMESEVPGYQAAELTTQGKILTERAVKRAELSRLPFLASTGAPVAAAGLTGAFSHNPVAGLAAGAAARALTEPAVTSRAALLFASPAFQEASRVAPRTAAFLLHEVAQQDQAQPDTLNGYPGLGWITGPRSAGADELNRQGGGNR